MIRSALAKAVPTVGTIVAVLYTRERKGWVWAVPAGLLAHFATSWLTSRLLGAVEGDALLPAKPVELKDSTVVPPLEAPVATGNVTDIGKLDREPVEVFEGLNNVIKLPTAMGEP